MSISFDSPATRWSNRTSTSPNSSRKWTPTSTGWMPWLAVSSITRTSTGIRRRCWKSTRRCPMRILFSTMTTTTLTSRWMPSFMTMKTTRMRSSNTMQPCKRRRRQLPPSPQRFLCSMRWAAIFPRSFPSIWKRTRWIRPMRSTTPTSRWERITPFSPRRWSTVARSTNSTNSPPSRDTRAFRSSWTPSAIRCCCPTMARAVLKSRRWHVYSFWSVWFSVVRSPSSSFTSSIGSDRSSSWNESARRSYDTAKWSITTSSRMPRRLTRRIRLPTDIATWMERTAKTPMTKETKPIKLYFPRPPMIPPGKTKFSFSVDRQLFDVICVVSLEVTI